MYTRHVDSSSLGSSLSSHRQSFIGLVLFYRSWEQVLFSLYRFNNKQKGRSSPFFSDVNTVRKYRGDYNNNPPKTVSFMTVIASTSGRLHSEFVRLLFLQSHRETDRFFTDSEVQLA